MTSQNLKPLVGLQTNTSGFFNQFQQKYQANMQCQMGCSQCCHVELSIFEVEAAAIVDWVKNLDQQKKQELLQLLQLPEQTPKDPKKKACTFLKKDKCTIYEARPIICRTQGLPLQYKKQKDKNNTQIFVDVCPLNFTKKDSFPEQKEWLDLDRLNSLQSIAENFYQKGDKQGEIFPKNKEGRVELKKLKEKIVEMIKGIS